MSNETMPDGSYNCPMCNWMWKSWCGAKTEARNSGLDDVCVIVPRSLIRRAQQAINYHLEPNSPDEHEQTMLELENIGWPDKIIFKEFL